jgi:predicted dehydrogenase
MADLDERNTMGRRITRRTLLRNAAYGGSGLLILRNSASVWSFQANEKLNTAHIGVGGRGGDLLQFTFLKQANPVAFCDVNENKATQIYRLRPDVPRFKDFRQMLDTMGRQIDAVVVATPDHTHAVASAAAIRAGKHVYTEKPLSRTIYESRVLRSLARRHNVAASMGNQGTASGQFRRALELIRQGVLGQIKEVHVWNESGGADHKASPTEETKVPEYLNWDLWLGPAQMRPFNAKWLGWSQWRDFGTGLLGNWASHTANLAFMALKGDSLWYADPASRPIIRVEAKVPAVNRISFSKWETVTWQVPPRGDLPAIPFHWYNGRGPGFVAKIEEMLGREIDWGDKGEKKWADYAGCLIIGTEGRLHATGHNATVDYLPRDKYQGPQKDRPEMLDASHGHEQDWILACKGGKPAWANYDYAGPLNEFLQLGNIATQFEAPIEYDPLAGRIINNKEADALLTCEYRAGWSL